MSHSTQYRSFGDDIFNRSCDPTNSVKALKEDGQSSDQASIPPGPPHRVTIIQHACSENTKTHMHLSTVK